MKRLFILVSLMFIGIWATTLACDLQETQNKGPTIEMATINVDLTMDYQTLAISPMAVFRPLDNWSAVILDNDQMASIKTTASYNYGWVSPCIKAKHLKQRGYYATIAELT